MSRRALDTLQRRARTGRRLGALLLIGALLMPANAQDTAAPLGRLFFTPERRQALDRQRQLNIEERQESSDDPTLTINGVVARSSGKRTVWINGAAQNEKLSGVAVAAQRNDTGQVVVHAADIPAANARVGDTVNRHTGEIADLLNGGSIKPGRPRASSPR